MNNAIGQGEYPILPEIKIPLPVGDELPVPVIQGGISLNQNWDKNGNIFYTDENGNKVNDNNFFNNIGNKVKAFGANVKDLLNPNVYDRRDTQYTSPYDVLKDQYNKGEISQNELVNLSQNRMEDNIYRAKKEQNENNLRAGLGTALSGASFHPALNIPYAGTGLGGAMYDVGQGIVEGDNASELLDRAKRGFIIGETVGAIPYAGKGINKLSGGKIGDVMQKGVNGIAETPFVQKVNDALTTDVRGNWIKGYHGTPYTGKINRFKYDPTKQTGTDFGEAYYFTNDFDNASGYGYDVTKDIDVIKLQDERKNIISKGLDAFENGDMQTYYETQKMLKNNSKNIQDAINTGRHNKTGGQVIKANLDFKNPYIADAQGANYFDVYPNYFKNAREGGYDSIIARNVLDSSKTGLKPSDTYIAFSPEQIKQIQPQSLFDYLKNDSILTQGYRDNKKLIDNTVNNLYKKINTKFPSLKHYQNPRSDFRLPNLNQSDLALLGKEQKPVVIKPNIVTKNKNNHPELDINDYNDVIENGLYNAKYLIQTEPVKKPNYYNFIAPRNNKHDNVVIELNETKDNYEIVGWYFLKDKGLKTKLNAANKNGGQSIITKR